MKTFFVTFAALALSACASSTEDGNSASSEERDCFTAASVNGYEVVDDHAIRVRVSASRRYTLHTSWNASDLDWSQALALRSSTNWICTGNARGLVEITGGPLGRTFPIDSITRDPEPPADQQGS
jgi:hypothetical protein